MTAEFDKHAASYDGGLDNPIKRMMGDSADQFIAVKARWLLRREPGLRTAGLAMLDYGCGAGDLMRVLAGMGTKASFTGLRRLDRHAGPRSASAGPRRLARRPPRHRRRVPGHRSPDGQFDVATISAVLHHVPIEERAAVYAELGRVVKPGGRIYVFEHNPRNPLVRYVIARTPIDENAILLDAREVHEGLLGAARYELETDYLMFMPPGLAFLSPIDRALAWLPLGAQYVVAARKPISQPA